jgi:hypothetical protein
MSLREVPSSKPLLARKGAAAPANLHIIKGGAAEPTLRPVDSKGEAALDLAKPDSTVDPAAVERKGEIAPAASLLPFDLLRKKYRPELSPDLVEDEPDILVGDLVAEDRTELRRPDASPQAELALHGEPAPKAPKLTAPPKFRAELTPEPRLDSRPESRSDSAPKHRPEPRVDVTIPTPAQARTPASISTPTSAPAPVPAPSPAAAPVPSPHPDWRVGVAAVAAPKRAPRSGWLLPLGALAVAFAALIAGWNMTRPTVDLASQSGADASGVAAPIAMGQATDETNVPATVEREAAEPATAEQATAEPVTVEPPPVAEADAPEPPATAAEAAPESPALESPAPELPAPPAPPAVAVATPAMPESKLPEPKLSSPTLTAPMPSIAAPLPPKLPATGPASEPDTAAPAAGESAAVTPTVIKPTVDVVRLEANGDAVIAGRAAPNSELIVLDNGNPIGTVRADAFGEWVFVPENPLPIGDHEFGLVLKTIQESVSLPAPSKPSLPPAPAPVTEPAAAAPDSAVDTQSVPSAPEPAASSEAASPAETNSVPAADTGTPAGLTAPLPARRPAVEELGAAPGTPSIVATADGSSVSVADFVVQLASVKTRDGAHQEWRKLQLRFPEILADMVPALDEVKLADHGTVVRVRTGAFSNQREAASLCARLVSKNQECLVVRVSTGN